MSKTVIPLTAKLVKFDTTVPFAEVISRLNTAVNKEGSGNITEMLKSVNTQDEFVAVINDTIGDSEFLYFMEFKYHRLLEYADGVKKPSALVYTIGNPVIAQTILEYNIFAAYNIPPRLLILEKLDEIGTTVSYYLPSSVMGQLDGGDCPVLHARIQDLDIRLEKLVERITKPVY